jgi:hypothetical protein
MTPRKTKECLGCGDKFLTFKNYDYCPNCAINDNRYLSPSNCSECDGSGIIKFPQQKPRPCKLCSLTKNPMNKKITKPLRLTTTEKYWDQVDLLAQEKIYQLLTKNIPLPNLNLITEAYRYEDKQEKLTGLFLHKDVDYRTLLADVENQYSEELPDKDYLAEEIVLWYCRMVIKSLISDCREYPSYDPSLFENLTNDY